MSEIPASRGAGLKLWPFALLLLVCISFSYLVARAHLIVDLTNDSANRALLNAPDLRPGTSATGHLTLGDGGIAPITYTLTVRGPGGSKPPSPLHVSIQSADGRTLYSGPAPAEAVTLGTLQPGAAASLKVTAFVPSNAAPADAIVPLDVTFTWSAHPAIIWTAWWLWAIGVILLLAALALAYLLRGSLRRQRVP